MSEKVLESFKRFDADSSGAISREELGAVLKELDDSWSDEAVDQLLLQADASGDGQLQMEEFVSWVFAEDASLQVGQGDFTLLISGCSRESLNGEYVQEKGRTFGGRPVFHCATNKRLLYYWKKEERWQIGPKTKKKSPCQLVTKRAAHLSDAKWCLWNKDEGSFVEEPEMTCKLYVPDPREEAAKAPEVIRPVQGDGYGTYSKRNTFRVDKRPIYFCGDDDTFIMYSEKVRKWKVCTVKAEDDGTSDGAVMADRENLSRRELEADEGKIAKYMKMDKRCIQDDGWHFVARLGFTYPIGWSEETDSYSPVKATWYHPEEEYLVEWEAVDAGEYATAGPGWTDPLFPPDSFSLGDPAGSRWEGRNTPCWRRAVDLTDEPVLFGTEEPADAMQGCIGNCGMVSALATLADFPGFLSSKFLTKEIPEDGKYQVEMYLPLTFEHNKTEKTLQVVEVDDYLPCSQPVAENRPRTAYPMFCKLANGNKLYMCILEKCFAKQVGSYSALNGFDSRTVFKALTGCEESFTYTDLRPSDERPKDCLTGPEWQVTAAEGVPVMEKMGRHGPEGEKVGVLMEGATFKEVDRRTYYVQFKKLSGEGPEEGWLPYFLTKTATRTAVRKDKRWWHFYSGSLPEEPDMFQKLMELDQANYPLSTGPFKRSGMSKDGLVFPHAYSILNVKEVNGFKMVCSRNPWGHGEWKGPWCDDSNEWTLHPEVAEGLQYESKSDGAFWMEWEDFQWNMGTIQGMAFSIPAGKAR